MKWQIHATLIAGVAFVGAGRVQAQGHHNVHTPTTPMHHNSWQGNGNLATTTCGMRPPRFPPITTMAHPS